MLATSVEIATAIFDFAVTATAMYPKLGSPGGLFILLRWSQANGTYTAWGTFLWLRKQIFWVNLWQRSGEGKKPGVARIDELDAWVRQLTKSIYAGEDIILDGYGFMVNPTGTKSQPWHVDYALDDATLYVPMSPLTPDNAIQLGS